MTKKDKDRHVTAENYKDEMKPVIKLMDGLCPGCRLRLLTLVTAHYINLIDENERVNYALNYMMGLNAALQFVEIAMVEVDGEETRH